MHDFGQLKTITLPEEFKHETNDFTPWLAQNIDKLGNALNMDLEYIDREVSVGDFALDLLAKIDGTSKNVVIENQFSQTNHDHLGKLLTYAGGNDASVVVWVSEKIRDEHRQALEWLNQRTDTDTQFFGVVAEILQIDNSKPALIFKLVVFPNEWQKLNKQQRVNDMSPRHQKYRTFFDELTDELKEKHNFDKNAIIITENRRNFSSGFSGISYRISFAQGNKVRVDLRIYQGQCENRIQIFDELKNRKNEITQKFENTLEWQRNPEKQETFIIFTRDGSIEVSDKELNQIRDWLITNLLKLIDVFQPEIERALEAIDSNDEDVAI